MIDTHCHLTDKRFASDREDVISRARAGGVRGMICVLTEFSPADISLFNELISRDGIWGAAGCHLTMPQDTETSAAFFPPFWKIKRSSRWAR